MSRDEINFPPFGLSDLPLLEQLYTSCFYNADLCQTSLQQPNILFAFHLSNVSPDDGKYKKKQRCFWFNISFFFPTIAEKGNNKDQTQSLQLITTSNV